MADYEKPRTHWSQFDRRMITAAKDGTEVEFVMCCAISDDENDTIIQGKVCTVDSYTVEISCDGERIWLHKSMMVVTRVLTP